MYQPFNPPENILIIHKAMVDEELQRNHPERHRRFHDIDRPSALGGVRRAIARGLVALGSRLDPTAGMPAAAPSGLRA